MIIPTLVKALPTEDRDLELQVPGRRPHCHPAEPLSSNRQTGPTAPMQSEFFKRMESEGQQWSSGPLDGRKVEQWDLR